MVAVHNHIIDLRRLKSDLAHTRFGANVNHFANISSTNTALLAEAANGAPDGTVFLADEQTGGRGRGGHAWHSAPGQGLYLSALVKPQLPLREALLISLATGLAAHQAICDVTTLDIDLRWPNDLMLHGKKLGGILAETSVAPDAMLRYAVIGIGINVHQTEFPDELAPLATSLDIERNPRTRASRTPLATAFLLALERELRRLERPAHNTEDLLQRFCVHSTWVLGKRVQVAEAGGYTGTTDGLDARGYLRVLDDEGTLHTVMSGGVREAPAVVKASGN